MYCYASFRARNSSGATLHKYSVYDVPSVPCAECVLGDLTSVTCGYVYVKICLYACTHMTLYILIASTVHQVETSRFVSYITQYRGGSRGGVCGVATAPNGPSPTYTMQYYISAWCAGALIYIAKSTVVSLVCSEQAVKPHSI